MNSYWPKFRVIYLSILLFALLNSSAHAIDQAPESSLTLSSSKSAEVIYLAQSSEAENSEEEILLEDETEEEEEPDCD